MDEQVVIATPAFADAIATTIILGGFASLVAYAAWHSSPSTITAPPEALPVIPGQTAWQDPKLASTHDIQPSNPLPAPSHSTPALPPASLPAAPLTHRGRRHVDFGHQPVKDIQRFDKEQKCDVRWKDNADLSHHTQRIRHINKLQGPDALMRIKEMGNTGLVDVLQRTEAMVDPNVVTQDPVGTGLVAELRANAHPDLDTWIEPWGKVPNAILLAVDKIIEQDIFEFNKLAPAVWHTVSKLRDKTAYPFAAVFRDPLPTSSDMNEWNIISISHASQRNLLLGFVLLPLRGWPSPKRASYLWLDRPRHSETMNSEQVISQRLGIALSNALSDKAKAVVVWLDWLGRRWLIHRVFSIAGAELLDGSCRLKICRILERKNDSVKSHGFRIDLTVFTPNWLRHISQLADKAPPKHFAHDEKWWTRIIQDTLDNVFAAASDYVDDHYKETTVDEGDFRVPKTIMRRLFFRPGLTHDTVTKFENPADKKASEYTMSACIRRARYVEIDTEQLGRLPGDTADRLDELMTAVNGIITVFRPSHVAFNNQRQYNWLSPRPGLPKALLTLLQQYNDFDSGTMSVMTNALQRASDAARGDDYTQGPHGGRASDLSRGHTLWASSTMDFGGMMPIGRDGSLPWIKMQSVTEFWLPLVCDTLLTDTTVDGHATGRKILDPRMWRALSEGQLTLTILVDCPRAVVVNGERVLQKASFQQGQFMLQKQLTAALPGLLHSIIGEEAPSTTLTGAVMDIVRIVNQRVVLGLSDEYQSASVTYVEYALDWLWSRGTPKLDGMPLIEKLYKSYRQAKTGGVDDIELLGNPPATAPDHPLAPSLCAAAKLAIDAARGENRLETLPLPHRQQAWANDILDTLSQCTIDNMADLKAMEIDRLDAKSADDWMTERDIQLSKRLVSAVRTPELASLYHLDKDQLNDAITKYSKTFAKARREHNLALRKKLDLVRNPEAVHVQAPRQGDLQGWAEGICRVLDSHLSEKQVELSNRLARTRQPGADFDAIMTEALAWADEQREFLKGILKQTVNNQALASRFKVKIENEPGVTVNMYQQCLPHVEEGLATLINMCNEHSRTGGLEPSPEAWKESILGKLRNRIHLACTATDAESTGQIEQLPQWLTYVMGDSRLAAEHGLDKEAHLDCQRRLRPEADKIVEEGLEKVERLCDSDTPPQQGSPAPSVSDESSDYGDGAEAWTQSTLDLVRDNVNKQSQILRQQLDAASDLDTSHGDWLIDRRLASLKEENDLVLYDEERAATRYGLSSSEHKAARRALTCKTGSVSRMEDDFVVDMRKMVNAAFAARDTNDQARSEHAARRWVQHVLGKSQGVIAKELGNLKKLLNAHPDMTIEKVDELADEAWKAMRDYTDRLLEYRDWVADIGLSKIQWKRARARLLENEMSQRQGQFEDDIDALGDVHHRQRLAELEMTRRTGDALSSEQEALRLALLQRLGEEGAPARTGRVPGVVFDDAGATDPEAEYKQACNKRFREAQQSVLDEYCRDARELDAAEQEDYVGDMRIELETRLDNAVQDATLAEKYGLSTEQHEAFKASFRKTRSREQTSVVRLVESAASELRKRLRRKV